MPVYDVPYSSQVIPPNPAFPTGRTAMRPVLVATLINGTQRLSCLTIVDSGADHCAFPRLFMQPLGLNALTAPSESTTGVGGSVPSHFCNIEIDFGVVRIPVYAGFTTGLDQVGVGLLGQTGFFDRFNITFRHSQGIFQVEIP